MKINNIEINRKYNDKNQIELTNLNVFIDFDPANPDNKPDSDALYYLICSLVKCNGKSHKNLDVIEKMEVLNRLDSTIAKLIQIKKDINERN